VVMVVITSPISWPFLYQATPETAFCI